MKNAIFSKLSIIKTLLLLLMISLIISGCILGCGIFKNNPGQQSEQTEQEDKIPKQLEAMELSLEKIFKAFGGPSVNSEEEKSDQKTQGKEKGAQANQSQDPNQQKEDNSQNSAEQGSSPQDQGKGQEKQENPWEQLTTELQNLHFNWNEYLPELSKKNSKKEVIEGFSNALNNLTKIAESKDKNTLLLATNQLYSQIPDIYSLYKTKAPSELKRLAYYTRNSILNSMAADWVKTSLDLEELKTRWSLVKTTVDKEQQENSAKLDLSIYELEKVIKEQNQDLVLIKGKITLANIETLQKSMEKK
jgi:hypothetical protein